MKCFPSLRFLFSQCRRLAPVASLVLAANLVEIARAEGVQFRPAQLLYAGAAPLAPGSYAIPCVVDWNGDGRKDLVVGYQAAGKVALFLNVGTDASPAFASYSNLQAGGADIVHPSSGCGAPAPFVCDYDRDGRRDLLVGDGNYGYVYFYRNTNTDTAPILAPGLQLSVGSGPLSVTYRATPFVYDWDGDGRRDLLCGNGDGYVFFFKNIGVDQVPVYAPAIRVQAGGVDVNLGLRSVIRMFDWDGDGVKDLVGSSNTGVYWCRNSGSDAVPQFQSPVALCAPVSGSGLVPINTGPRMRLDLVDWNHDGAVDLIVGNASGTISFYEGYRFSFTRLTAQSPSLEVLQWNSAPFLSYHVLSGSLADAITNRVGANVPSSGNTTGWTNFSTEAQQFYRLQIAR